MQIKVGDIVRDREATVFDMRVTEVGADYIIAVELTTPAASVRYKQSEYNYLDKICLKCDNSGYDSKAFEMVCHCQRTP
jgi:hypothetical protein